ncbi:hypothetical protein RJ639_039203 [Escallonia herrerae]|uniref:CNNM transmembrane domain-containing protein n=1 Tax=Escallonia herrerae TaxID=1293975 RepID=A0AA88WMC9_9ASTE|nr:hypothetical protein RJ639_039203 [Escallonia herrerae]
MAAEYHYRNKEYDGCCCESQFLLNIITISMLAVFKGIISGLTMGLLSMSIVDLEVLVKSGTTKDSHRACIIAAKVLPIMKREHLLCTLLINYVAAVEINTTNYSNSKTALPISLHNLVPQWINIPSSVTLILLFGEITPRSACSQYSLVIGSALAPVVQRLDFLLGEGHIALFRQAGLKTLVNLHRNEAGKGGELSCDETTIISGTLDLTEKMAIDAMTSIAEIFAIDINAKLQSGHSRVLVYHEHPRNIVRLVLVKNLLSLNASDKVPLKNVTVHRIPSDARVSETMPLYDILNEFQKGLSQMAVVIRQRREMVDNSVKKLSDYDNIIQVGEVRLEIHTESHAQDIGSGSRRSLRKLKALPGSASASCRSETSKSRRWSEKYHPEILHIDNSTLSTFIQDEEAIGIRTMKDVIQELLKVRNYNFRTTYFYVVSNLFLSQS